jgi:phosphoribosylformylglycinamidine synthase subunit PurQ / glutaminase
MKPRILVLRAAGINCEVETAFAFERYGATTETVHVNRLLAGKTKLADFDGLALPGGFSYGDDIAAGKVLALELLRVRDDLLALVDRGGLVLGICNGFQALVKTGLLPGIEHRIGVQEATLADNDSNKYEDRWVNLVSVAKHSIFVKPGEKLAMSLAHGEGKFVTKDDAIRKAIHERGQVAFRYVDENGNEAQYPANPNGSIDGIAGLVDRTGRVMGLMPHPERAMFAVHHPDWTGHATARANDEGDGARVFKNAVAYLRG